MSSLAAIELGHQRIAVAALGIPAAPDSVHGAITVPVHLKPGDSVKSLPAKNA